MSPRRARAVSVAAGDDPAAALREHLIDAVERLLSQTPISAITTRDIARAADVSDGVLYNYFDDKTDLVVAALLRRYQRLATRFDEGLPLAGAGAVEDNLTAYARALLDLDSEVLPMVAGLITEPVLLHRIFEAIHREPFGPQQLRQPLVDYLEGERGLGRIGRAVDVQAIATLLMGAIGMLALTGHLGPIRDREALVSQVRPIVVSLVQGLRPEDDAG